VTNNNTTLQRVVRCTMYDVRCTIDDTADANECSSQSSQQESTADPSCCAAASVAACRLIVVVGTVEYLLLAAACCLLDCDESSPETVESRVRRFYE
jgi:hypothetical protein